MASCKKEGENIFNMFDEVNVTFHSKSPYSVTGYKEVNSGDSVHIEYTITSAKKGMHMLCVYEAGAGAVFMKIPLNASQRKTYSNVVKLKMNAKVGRTTYRIGALDSAGVYIGDGYKSITLDVLANYNYWAGRSIFVPDTLGMESKSYLSLKTGTTYSYKEGLTKSEDIDLGFVNNGASTVYALNASPLPFTPYDISSWTKKATLFAAAKNNQGTAFLNLKTGEQIESAAKSAKPTLKVVTNLAAGSLFYFITAEGKQGAIFVNYITRTAAVKGVFMNVDIKIKK